jgi:rhodanese-related sulfurtransferase
MKRKRILSCILSAVIISSTLASLNVTTAYASNVSETPVTSNTVVALQSVATIIDGGEIQVNGKTNKLYRVFSNENSAIASIKSQVPTLLGILAEEYNLTALSDNNWKDYRDAMFSLFDSENKPIDYNESNLEFRTLRAFFDIYENSDKNQQIKSLIAKRSVSANTQTDFRAIEDELALLLPYSEPLAKSFENRVALQTKASFNVTDAINYATTWARDKNTPTYYYFSNGDCANFVSQILENSGVNQVVYDSVGSGWWHKRKPGFLGIGYTHTHSQSWSMADTFARYQGIIYSTTSNYNFSAHLSNGTFVVADFQNDGDWDHCGFVTQRDNYVGSSYGYYDYKIAQHTSNYHAWASSSENNWENIGNDGGKYARVRT